MACVLLAVTLRSILDRFRRFGRIF